MKKEIPVILLLALTVFLTSGCGATKSSTAPVTIGQLGVVLNVDSLGYLEGDFKNNTEYAINNLKLEVKYRDDMGNDTLIFSSNVKPGKSGTSHPIINVPARSSADVMAISYSYQINNESTGEVKEIVFDTKSKLYTIKDYSK